MSVVLDAGALTAVDRRSRRVENLLELSRRSGETLRTPSPVVGQVWRDGCRQAGLARLLQRVDVLDVSEDHARRAGELLGTAGGSDVVDALVALAARGGDTVLTSDPENIARLLEARGQRARVVAV
ncbi:MAG: PIN domain-containing protein [Kineosporiaceae bacterium]